MSKIVLISCVSMKKDVPSKAEDLYISSLFVKSLKYAKQQNPDKIFILSAKYGLVDTTEILEPYDLTLKKFSKDEKIKWSNKIIEKLKMVSSLENDKFIILAGNSYIEYILPAIKNYELPLHHMTIGLRQKWLKEHIKLEYLLF